ncbi:MAG: SurA N-terminal domain-containing protein [Vicinamibacterales bacterium]
MTGLGCANAQTAPSAQATTQNQDAVVAEVGGRKITMKELDDRWQSMDPAERARVTQLVYQNRRNVLDQMMGDELIEQAAKSAGMPVDEYTSQETAKRITPVTDAEVQQFFEENKDRAQGRTVEQLGASIRSFLSTNRQQQARAQLVDDLKKKSASRVFLDPPRQTVEVRADDPSIGPATAPVTIVEFSDYQ